MQRIDWMVQSPTMQRILLQQFLMMIPVEQPEIKEPTAATWLIQLILDTCSSNNDNVMNLNLFDHLFFYSNKHILPIPSFSC